MFKHFSNVDSRADVIDTNSFVESVHEVSETLR
jgi:hypothetical protein